MHFCREDLRRWFIQQEMDLFRYRFSDLPARYKTEFLHRNNLQYDTVRAFSFYTIICNHLIISLNLDFRQRYFVLFTGCFFTIQLILWPDIS